ncbi:MAG TPA: hypothetical protein VFI70_00640 [Nitrososphaeraceae archaeon]|nr:hypothetical protein [Nitrososphaeraceae archaeon]
MFERERTKPYVIRYALYLYFLGLSLRSTSKAIEPFASRSYISIWYWIQRFDPKRIYPSKRKRVPAFIIDEIQIQIGYNEAWLWVALEPINGQILGVYISRHRNILVTELFLKSLIKLYGKHTVYSNGGP